MKTTNYYNTFIQVADDCPVKWGEIPYAKNSNKTAAAIQFDLLINHPYTYSSDDVLFSVYAAKNNISEEALLIEREKFFSKSQACLRSSPLGKRYGWGLHFDKDGKVALYGLGTAEYERFSGDPSLKQVKAMRSSRIK